MVGPEFSYTLAQKSSRAKTRIMRSWSICAVSGSSQADRVRFASRFTYVSWIYHTLDCFGVYEIVSMLGD